MLADPANGIRADRGRCRMSDEVDTAAEPEVDEDAPVAPAAWRTQQAAKRLNIPYRTLMNLIHAGRLRTVPAGRYYLVPEAAIQEFLDGARTAS